MLNNTELTHSIAIKTMLLLSKRRSCFLKHFSRNLELQLHNSGPPYPVPHTVTLPGRDGDEFLPCTSVNLARFPLCLVHTRLPCESMRKSKYRCGEDPPCPARVAC